MSRVVRLQHYHDGAWRQVRKQTVARSGRYSFAVTQPEGLAPLSV